MLNKLREFADRYGMIARGDRVVCAVSGGADSMALLFAMYLLKDKWQISLSAAHFNHGLRGAESDRDQQFVRDFCLRYDIPLYEGAGQVTAGKKGLEAAARDARYGFLRTLPGKIATAHTADDNAETVLMHLVRGTGLKGLGGIMPVNGNLIRPLLNVTRGEILEFLEEYHIPYVTDSSNRTDDFLRNRIRHHVIPVLKQENPRLAQNLSAMALRLRDDEDALFQPAEDNVEVLKNMHPAHRSRALAAFLENCGVKEPDARHIAQTESLVFSANPSARACFPGGITVSRNYGKLVCGGEFPPLTPVELVCPGDTYIPELDMTVRCLPGAMPGGMWVQPEGRMVLRSRIEGDEIRLNGGSKTLKKLFIDKKIPANLRNRVAVIADEKGVLGICGIGANISRIPQDTAGVSLFFETPAEANE